MLKFVLHIFVIILISPAVNLSSNVIIHVSTAQWLMMSGNFPWEPERNQTLKKILCHFPPWVDGCRIRFNSCPMQRLYIRFPFDSCSIKIVWACSEIWFSNFFLIHIKVKDCLESFPVRFIYLHFFFVNGLSLFGIFSKHLFTFLHWCFTSENDDGKMTVEKTECLCLLHTRRLGRKTNRGTGH